MSTGLTIAQLLVAALEVYRTHHAKPADWVPTAEDWNGIIAEAELYTAERFKEEARAALKASSSSPPEL